MAFLKEVYKKTIVGVWDLKKGVGNSMYLKISKVTWMATVELTLARKTQACMRGFARCLQ